MLSGDISQYDSVPIELEIHSLDGKKKCIELKPFRAVEGEELLLIGIVMDITEKRRLLEELVEREHTFRAIAESSPAAIMLTDSNGNNIYVSPNIERLTGFPPEEFLGSVRWVVHPDDYERMSEALELLEHQEIYSIVKERTSKSYKTISMEDMAKSFNIDLEKQD